MAHRRFLDRELEPDEAHIREAIGWEVLPVWDAVVAYLGENFPHYQPEMVFYNAQRGWARRYRKGSQQLVLLFPETRGFSALITLNPEEETQALDKLNYFNDRIRETLSQFSSLSQGRLLWFRLEDHTDFVGFKLLMTIKGGSLSSQS